MADKAIGSLVEATVINDADRFVLEQGGQAKKISGATMISEFAEALDGHGGIQSIDLIGGEGNTKTYRITMTDGSSYDFSVQDGASGNYAATAGQLLSTKYTEDSTTPYVIKACESGGSNRADESLIGGTFAWNQQVKADGTEWAHDSEATYTYDTATRTITGTYTTSSARVWRYGGTVKNHVYYIAGKALSSVAGDFICEFSRGWVGSAVAVSANTLTEFRMILKPTADSDSNLRTPAFMMANKANYTLAVKDMQLIDLTICLGPTIADYIYSLEQATAGSGGVWFQKYFRKPYYAHCAGALYSVNVGHKENTGFNLVKDVISGTYTGYGNTMSSDKANVFISSLKELQKLGKTYYYRVTGSASGIGEIRIYAHATLLLIMSPNSTFSLSNVDLESATTVYIYGTNPSSTVTLSEVCINIHGDRDGDYEPYREHSVIFDNTVHLRGLPKLVDGELSFDGNDTYESTGVVTKKYGIVDLGTLGWGAMTYAGVTMMTTGFTTHRHDPPNINLRCSKYEVSNDIWSAYTLRDKLICNNYAGSVIYVYDSAYTDAAAFKAAMSGVYLLYELTDSTKEIYDSFDNPQVIYDGGTNYFVDYSCENGDRDVEIPVGHSTRFLANLAGTLDSMIGALPSADGTYTLKATVSSGKITYSWVAD